MTFLKINKINNKETVKKKNFQVKKQRILNLFKNKRMITIILIRKKKMIINLIHN